MFGIFMKNYFLFNMEPVEVIFGGNKELLNKYKNTRINPRFYLKGVYLTKGSKFTQLLRFLDRRKDILIYDIWKIKRFLKDLVLKKK